MAFNSGEQLKISQFKRVYFIGIGGIGMSALARYFKSIGIQVSGYDKTPSDLTTKLIAEGISIHFEDKGEQIGAEFHEIESTLVVYTPAIPINLGELCFFKEHQSILLKRSEVLGLLKQTVRPEFINRIDEIVMFTPLTHANIAQIVGLQLKSVTKMLAQQGITMDATPEAITYLSQKGYDPQFGARPVKRVIQREVLNQLSKEILAGTIKTESIILLDAFDGQLVFRNQGELVS